MQNLPFKQVDVFTGVPSKGNPLAVVLKADGLTGERMQQIANRTNLSQTTFVLPATSPAADYRVRIFTPAKELPFAGHPTIGSAHALLEAGLVEARDGVLVQECRNGLVHLRVARDDRGALDFVRAAASRDDAADRDRNRRTGSDPRLRGVAASAAAPDRCRGAVIVAQLRSEPTGACHTEEKTGLTPS